MLRWQKELEPHIKPQRPLAVGNHLHRAGENLLPENETFERSFLESERDHHTQVSRTLDLKMENQLPKEKKWTSSSSSPHVTRFKNWKTSFRRDVLIDHQKTTKRLRDKSWMKQDQCSVFHDCSLNLWILNFVKGIVKIMMQKVRPLLTGRQNACFWINDVKKGRAVGMNDLLHFALRTDSLQMFDQA